MEKGRQSQLPTVANFSRLRLAFRHPHSWAVGIRDIQAVLEGAEEAMQAH